MATELPYSISIEPKIPNLISKIKERGRSEEFIIIPHAMDRKKEWNISIIDIVHVLINGEHEESKDQYKPEYRAWNYAVRGKTVDNRDLRIAVSFDEKHMLIITVIRLGRKR